MGIWEWVGVVMGLVAVAWHVDSLRRRHKWMRLCRKEMRRARRRWGVEDKIARRAYKARRARRQRAQRV